jgi:hypothetical protein
MRFASIALQTIVILTVSAPAFAGPREFDGSPDDLGDLNRLRRIISPHIEGDALIIEGRIDSHIYDYIQYEAARVAAVRVVDLNSLGGNAEWALEIARKLKELGKTTLLRSQHHCASACAYIFAAGRERMAAEDTWIGIHGARLGPGYTTNFEGLCFEDLEGRRVFEPRKTGCREFFDHWYEVTLASTNEAFDLMESNGVSPELRTTYFSMPDDPGVAGADERYPQAGLGAQRR